MPGKCGRCGEDVYAAEQRLALSKLFHIRCFTCAKCFRTLDSYNLAENRELNEIFCKTCYRINFTTKGYGYGGLEPTLLALPSATTVRPSSSGIGGHKISAKENVQPPLCQPSEFRPPSTCKVNSTTIKTSHQIRTNLSTSTKSSNIEKMNQKQTLSASKINTPLPTMIRSGIQGIDCNKIESQASACLRPTCALPPLPRYPPKHSEYHRTPLKANSYKHGKDQSTCTERTCGAESKSCRQGATAKTAKNHPLGGGEPCIRCHKPVYWAEMKLSNHGAYHQECFSCCCCGKPLESMTVSENQGEIFCKGCYRRFFGTHGIGYGVGAGILQTP